MAEKFDIRSSIKRYAVEFVVIFLSVSLSFVADNLRDDATNREHEREAIQRLLRDVEADLDAFPQNLALANIGLSAIQSLSAPGAADSLSVQQIERQLQRYWICSVFDPNDSEYESLKAGGDLKLIRDDRIRQNLAKNYEAYSTLEFYHRDDCDRMPDTFRHIADEIEVTPSGYTIKVNVTGDARRIVENTEFRIALTAHMGLRKVLIAQIEESMSLLESLKSQLAD